MNTAPLDRFLDSLPDIGVPGWEILIHHNGKEVYTRYGGFADVESGKYIAPDMRYYLYSASKVVTCTAALMLMESGAISLDDKLGDYMPEFANMQVAADGSISECDTPILIRHLFTMTAGLTYDMGTPAMDKARTETEGRMPVEDVMRAIAASPLAFKPGEKWLYSLCHDVLGGLIERVSGKTFFEYLREKIFAPLGMNDTTFRLREDDSERMPTLYVWNGELRRRNVYGKNDFILGTEYESGGAGLISTVGDYIKFADALIGGRLISRATLELMRTDMLNDAQHIDYNWEQCKGYGYGLGVRTRITPLPVAPGGAIGEFGWGGAGGCYTLFDAENGVSIFYAQHMLYGNEPLISQQLRDLTYQMIFE